MQVKLQSNREQLLANRKQSEVADEAQRALQTRVTELTSQCDACRAQGTLLTQDKEALQRALESARSDKSALERARQELTSSVSAMEGNI